MIKFARKRFGQHFLIDPSILAKMVGFLSLKETDCLVEIGPGRGALTDYLINKTQFLELIELDRDLVELLEHRYANYSQVHICSGDVLNVVWSNMYAKANQKLRVIGNLPYNISTPLLINLFNESKYIFDMHFLVQKEVAERLCASVGDTHYGRLSVVTQFYCQPELLFLVEPSAFDPAPKVRSAFIRLKMLEKNQNEQQNQKFFIELVKIAFAHRRKTLGNNLKSLIPPDMLSTIDIDPSWRPQQVSVSDFCKIARLIIQTK